jgi:hypothetical protein
MAMDVPLASHGGSGDVHLAGGGVAYLHTAVVLQVDGLRVGCQLCPAMCTERWTYWTYLQRCRGDRERVRARAWKQRDSLQGHESAQRSGKRPTCRWCERRRLWWPYLQRRCRWCQHGWRRALDAPPALYSSREGVLKVGAIAAHVACAYRIAIRPTVRAGQSGAATASSQDVLRALCATITVQVHGLQSASVDPEVRTGPKRCASAELGQVAAQSDVDGQRRRGLARARARRVG